jgi:hypothetical protein
MIITENAINDRGQTVFSGEFVPDNELEFLHTMSSLTHDKQPPRVCDSEPRVCPNENGGINPI